MSSRKELLPGQKFNFWTVVSYEGGSRYRFRCECGNEKCLKYFHIVSNNSKSCGCYVHTTVNHNFKDHTGQIIGDYRVLNKEEPTTTPGGQKKTTWKVQCTYCHRIKKLAATNLNANKGITCYCQRREKAEQNVTSFWKMFVQSYKDGARTREIKWKLTDEEVKHIATQNCHYCQAIPSPRKAYHRSYCVVDVNGIDRVDNLKGYEIDNVVPCCYTCNRMKTDMNVDDFISHITRISQNKS